MITSKQIVNVMTFNHPLESKIGNLWLSWDGGSDVLDLEGFDSEEELVELLAKLSLTHYIEDIRRTDVRKQTDIDIIIVPSTNGLTNINADVVKTILDFYVSVKEYWEMQ